MGILCHQDELWSDQVVNAEFSDSYHKVLFLHFTPPTGVTGQYILSFNSCLLEFYCENSPADHNPVY